MSTPFFNFSDSPPLGKVIKIYSPPFKKGDGGEAGAGGPNYVYQITINIF